MVSKEFNQVRRTSVRAVLLLLLLTVGILGGMVHIAQSPADGRKDTRHDGDGVFTQGGGGRWVTDSYDALTDSRVSWEAITSARSLGEQTCAERIQNKFGCDKAGCESSVRCTNYLTANV
eukprot:gb/GECG01008106.1/.p1 GENE.gb/GECG01008106.1/~~gb/GECG01008106.1/.p1  ORF type:complete len:120 (+),score=4.27 gb/GECG01008106.1/:1-360(+)